MQQVDEVLDFLNDRLGSQDVEWRGNLASIQFEEGYIVDFVKIDAQTLELVSLVDQFRGELNATSYQRLLVANYQGAMTGQFRVSITPTEETLAVCGRVDVTMIDSDSLEELIGDFVDLVKFWNSPDAMQFLSSEDQEDHGIIASGEEDFIVTRI